MNVPDNSSRITVLLGAGFNADAKAQVGPVFGHSIYIGRHEIQCGYPLASDLARVCFGIDQPPTGRSIEDLFYGAQQSGDLEPMRRLADVLMKADYYLPERLIPALGAPQNPYSSFFDRFVNSHFLTFNYDSLAELFLLHRERWYPHDGYGVPVAAELAAGAEDIRKRSSPSLVLHLHGSLCVYTSTFTFEKSPGDRVAWYTPREEPKFLFDPDSIGLPFTPFARSPLVLGYPRPERRVVAPVPDKTEGLTKEFIASVYQRAAEVLRSSLALVVVGYSFNPHDASSYAPILAAAASRGLPVVVVSPDAREVEARVAPDYPGSSFEPVPRTFVAWAEAGFPGAP